MSHDVKDMMLLNELQHEIDGIFQKISDEFGLSKNEYVVMVALWNNGPMAMRALDKYIDIKPYKRTRFFNNLVSKGWITKERPSDDERTVIIHYNEDKAPEKEKIVKAACKAISDNLENLRKHFNAVLSICESQR
ncbi:transcriptional regulator, SarA/Rot family [Macrococcus equipercicus]|uniref:MarR family transcriptional regulator n=1 Tax=Macrococcus equipercicus TaxID=69967 RepID=A0A9Q9F0X3_9STAP|nr:MarR family transcriptional regulator [Macrococcus equipercicus]KAA1038387.1 MarR family transcriptional regulator [Macrococcus equipercicus]UTH13225.1 MarR family transcriptional regulator [Macrococcus equipercicus]